MSQDTPFRDQPIRWAYIRLMMAIQFPFCRGMGFREGFRLSLQAGRELGDLTPNQVIALCKAADEKERGGG